MNNLRGITLSGLLISTAVVMQLVPAFMSELFVVATILSSLPIFIISIINPKFGILSYLSAAILISIISIHEGMMFVFTNGLIGAVLGISGFYLKDHFRPIIVSGLFMFTSLVTLNYVIGISIFGSNIPGPILVQIMILLTFSLIYCALYNRFAHFIYKFFKKQISIK